MDVEEILLTILFGAIILIVIFGIICFLAFPFCNLGFDVGGGKQAGYIVEIEESGVFWRPPEVRLLNIVTTYSTEDTSWHYGIEPELKAVALEYQKSNTPVEVEYDVRRFTWNWEYANRDVIVGITPLNKTKEVI